MGGARCRTASGPAPCAPRRQGRCVGPYRPPRRGGSAGGRFGGWNRPPRRGGSAGRRFGGRNRPPRRTVRAWGRNARLYRPPRRNVYISWSQQVSSPAPTEPSIPNPRQNTLPYLRFFSPACHPCRAVLDTCRLMLKKCKRPLVAWRPPGRKGGYEKDHRRARHEAPARGGPVAAVHCSDHKS